MGNASHKTTKRGTAVRQPRLSFPNSSIAPKTSASCSCFRMGTEGTYLSGTSLPVLSAQVQIFLADPSPILP